MSRFPCPNCGAILDANLAQPPPQFRRNADANGEIAHVSKAVPSTKKERYNQGYDPLFLAFWDAYPLKRDKRKALFAWRKSIARANANAILEGAKRYRDDPNRMPEFTKYAEGWLNGDGWEDEPLPVRLNGKDPEAEERERLRQRKLESARRYVEEERRVR